MAKITIYAYVEKSIQELRKFQNDWVHNNLANEEHYPKEMEEGEWGQQELAERFGQ